MVSSKHQNETADGRKLHGTVSHYRAGRVTPWELHPFESVRDIISPMLWPLTKELTDRLEAIEKELAAQRAILEQIRDDLAGRKPVNLVLTLGKPVKQ
jgi:hypothetical protein